MDLTEIKKFLSKLNQENIIFDGHFYKRTAERPINEGMIRDYLSKIEKLEKIEIGKGSNRFKLWFRMSRRYSLVVIIEIILSKDLKVISAWNTNRQWQDQLKQ
jgi:hypothetical protein